MRKISRLLLFGALTLVLLTTACAGQEGSPTAVGTTAPGEETASSPTLATDITASPEATVNTTATIDTATAPAGTDTAETATTGATQTPAGPGTGAEPISLECQFCILDMAHALLVLPDTATFETVADTATLSTPGPDTGCNTVDTYNGRQIVICRSQENTSLNLNICTDGNNCTQLLVELQDCPDVTEPGATATGTPEAAAPTDTAAAEVTETPLPTATP